MKSTNVSYTKRLIGFLRNEYMSKTIKLLTSLSEDTFLIKADRNFFIAVKLVPHSTALSLELTGKLRMVEAHV